MKNYRLCKILPRNAAALIIFLMLWILTSPVLGSARYWTNGTGNRIWNDPLNWLDSFGSGVHSVPVYPDDAGIYGNTLPPILGGTVPNVATLYVGYFGSGTGILNIATGDSFNLSYLSVGSTSYGDLPGIVNVSGGSLSPGTTSIGKGSFNMTDGTFTTTTLNLATESSAVYMCLGGGVVIANQLIMTNGSFSTATAQIDLDAGVLQADSITWGVGTKNIKIKRGARLCLLGDQTSNVSTWNGNGWITAAAGEGTLTWDYNGANPGYTTVYVFDSSTSMSWQGDVISRPYDWAEPGNWDTNTIPGISSHARINNLGSSQLAMPVIGTNVGPVGYVSIAWDGVTASLSVDSGGVLNTPILHMGNNPASNATLNVDGGSVSATALYVGYKGTALINLKQGSLTATTCIIGPDNGQGGTGLINIENGTLYLVGDKTAMVDTWISNGRIKAYNGQNSLCRSYDSGSNKTTVVCITPPSAEVMNVLWKAISGTDRRTCLSKSEVSGIADTDVMYYINKVQKTGSVPLYELRNTGLTDRMDSTTLGEHGYNYVRTLGYAYPWQMPGMTSLRRLYNSTNSDHGTSPYDSWSGYANDSFAPTGYGFPRKARGMQTGNMLSISSGGVTIESNLNAGGCCWSWTHNGTQYINTSDLGRELQSAYFEYDYARAHWINPTEAGNWVTSSHGSALETAYNDGANRQVTRCIPLDFAEYDPFGGSTYNPVMYPAARLGKNITLNYNNMGPVVKYETIIVPPQSSTFAGAEIPTAYLLGSTFTRFWSYDAQSQTITEQFPPSSGGLELTPLSGYGGVIISSSDQTRAFGCYGVNTSAQGSTTVFAVYNFIPDTTKWSAAYRQSFLANHEYIFTTWVMSGTLNEVKSYMNTLYASGEVGAIKISPLPWNFNYLGNFQEWSSYQHTINESVTDGALKFDITGIDPIWLSPTTSINTAEYKKIAIRLKNQTAGTVAQFYWSNATGGPGSPGHDMTFTISANDTEFHDYLVDVSSASGWTGTVTQLRFDAPGNTGHFEIDSIEINDTTPPTPNPMTWATNPYATSSTAISMTATTATDASNPVEYYFDCTTTGGHDSSWQTSTTYSDTGLIAGTSYTYQVKTRDAKGNETSYSTQKSATTPSTWTQLTYDDFESGIGSYTVGGADCIRYKGTYSHQGSYSMDIQDNNGTASSFYHTNGINVHTPGYTEIKIEFWFKAVSMESGEDFWVQYYNGSSWQTIASYVAGTDFSNNTFYNKTVTINEASYTFPTSMKIRFMCDASDKNDDVYIDEIRVSAR